MLKSIRILNPECQFLLSLKRLHQLAVDAIKAAVTHDEDHVPPLRTGLERRNDLVCRIKISRCHTRFIQIIHEFMTRKTIRFANL